MLDKIKAGIKAVGGAIKAAGVVQAKLNALGDDIDLDGKPEMQEIKEKLPVIIEKGKALFVDVKELALLAWSLAKHVAEAD